MTDAIRECSKVAASIFAILVRIAPLAAFYISNHADEEERISDRVINHLILGKPMPPCVLPDAVSSQLKESRTVLRPYQVEGISWLKFLNDVKLNGALCDDMG
jgi:SNF2 family DNA or RNA helicase